MREKAANTLEIKTVMEVIKVKQIIIERPIEYQLKITSTAIAAQIGMAEIGDEAQEILLLVVLNSQNRINAIHRVFQGGLNSCVTQSREIFRSAILNNGARILLFHNHPSGDVEPSPADIYFTKKISEAGELLGIEVLDHIIVSDSNWLSLRDVDIFKKT